MGVFMVRFIRFALIIAAIALSISLGASGSVAGEKTTVDYRPELGQMSPKLDIYSFDGANNAPVLIYVHGGAWRWGHRIHVNQKPVHFNKSGFIFVSIDYRLVFSVRVEEQLDDVDHAIGWIAANIGKFGGDGRNLHLMGHSAGAHLVSMTGVRPGKNVQPLVTVRSLRTIISNDTLAYNVPILALATVLKLPVSAEKVRQRLPDIYQDVFGIDAKRWRRLSPSRQIDSQRVLPAFLLLYSHGRDFPYFGIPRKHSRRWLADKFKDKLKLVDTKVSIFDGSRFTHRQINALIGEDEELTGAIDEFLERFR